MKFSSCHTSCQSTVLQKILVLVHGPCQSTTRGTWTPLFNDCVESSLTSCQSSVILVERKLNDRRVTAQEERQNLNEVIKLETITQEISLSLGPMIWPMCVSVCAVCVCVRVCRVCVCACACVRVRERGSGREQEKQIMLTAETTLTYLWEFLKPKLNLSQTSAITKM